MRLSMAPLGLGGEQDAADLVEVGDRKEQVQAGGIFLQAAGDARWRVPRAV
jgi:hypothetical protein